MGSIPILIRQAFKAAAGGSADARFSLATLGFSGWGMMPAVFAAFHRPQSDGLMSTVKESNVKLD